jgi:ankyrin repeat protein
VLNRTYLHACGAEKEAITKFLIESGADVNARDKN